LVTRLFLGDWGSRVQISALRPFLSDIRGKLPHPPFLCHRMLERLFRRSSPCGGYAGLWRLSRFLPAHRIYGGVIPSRGMANSEYERLPRRHGAVSCWPTLIQRPHWLLVRFRPTRFIRGVRDRRCNRLRGLCCPDPTARRRAPTANAFCGRRTIVCWPPTPHGARRRSDLKFLLWPDRWKRRRHFMLPATCDGQTFLPFLAAPGSSLCSFGRMDIYAQRDPACICLRWISGNFPARSRLQRDMAFGPYSDRPLCRRGASSHADRNGLQRFK
jgi:hypothetical protein